MEDPDSSRPARPLAVAAGLLTLYLVWGSTYLGIKFAIETLPPLLMAGSRFLLAGAVLYVVLRLRGAAAPTWPQWRRATLTGALLLVGGNGLVTLAQQTVPSGQAALVVATTPLWMVVLAWLFWGGERPRPRTWLGLAVGFAGAVLLVLSSGKRIDGALTGALMLSLAPVCWSVGSMVTRRTPPTPDALFSCAMQMLAGGTLMFVLGAAVGEVPLLWARTVSLNSMLAFVYLAVMGGVVGFGTYAWLLRNASPAVASTYAFVNPLVAVLLGWLLGGESVEAMVAVAAALVVGAVLLITLPARWGRPAPSSGEIPAAVSVVTNPARKAAEVMRCSR